MNHQSKSVKPAKLFRATLLATLTLCSFALLSCESDEDNALSSAQQCLDKLKDSDSDAAADACAAKVAGQSSPESYVIRCSVNFFKGGVKSSTMIAAFDQYENAAANEKAAVLMAALSQSTAQEAEDTLAACQKSEVPSLIYVATVSLTGTLMTSLGGSTDPAVFLAACAAGGAGGVCEDATIGTAITSMYDVYCVGSAAESQTCTEINSAIAAGGGNPAQVAIQLYALLQ